MIKESRQLSSLGNATLLGTIEEKILKTAGAKIPTELTPRIIIDSIEINNPYFVYGYDQYCDYLLFIKDESNCLNLFYAWKNEDNTLRFSESLTGDINYVRVDIDIVNLKSSAVRDLFSPKRTLEEMADIIYDINYLFDTKSVITGIL